MLSRKCLLPPNGVKLWLEHLHEHAKNRRKALEKARGTMHGREGGREGRKEGVLCMGGREGDYARQRGHTRRSYA